MRSRRARPSVSGRASSRPVLAAAREALRCRRAGCGDGGRGPRSRRRPRSCVAGGLLAVAFALKRPGPREPIAAPERRRAGGAWGSRTARGRAWAPGGLLGGSAARAGAGARRGEAFCAGRAEGSRRIRVRAGGCCRRADRRPSRSRHRRSSPRRRARARFCCERVRCCRRIRPRRSRSPKRQGGAFPKVRSGPSARCSPSKRLRASADFRPLARGWRPSGRAILQSPHLARLESLLTQ